jgi:hypothetical protein
MTSALTFGGLGVVFLAIGVFLWNRLSKSQNKTKRSTHLGDRSSPENDFHHATLLRVSNRFWRLCEWKRSRDQRSWINFAGK